MSNAKNHFVRAQVLKSTCSPIMEQWHTLAQNVRDHLVEQILWRCTWQTAANKERSHIIVRSAGGRSAKEALWKPTSAFTMEKNLINAPNALTQMLIPVILNNTWASTQRQLTSFVLRQDDDHVSEFHKYRNTEWWSRWCCFRFKI